MKAGRIEQTLGLSAFCAEGYAREVPFGCQDDGLMSLLFFLPGQAMAPHRHLDSDEYFTALVGSAEMLVDGEIVRLAEGQTYLRPRGTLHALRNASAGLLVVQSFQAPLPTEAGTVWANLEGWLTTPGRHCPRCWCGQIEQSICLNCGARCTERGIAAHMRRCER